MIVLDTGQIYRFCWRSRMLQENCNDVVLAYLSTPKMVRWPLTASAHRETLPRNIYRNKYCKAEERS